MIGSTNTTTISKGFEKMKYCWKQFSSILTLPHVSQQLDFWFDMTEECDTKTGEATRRNYGSMSRNVNEIQQFSSLLPALDAIGEAHSLTERAASGIIGKAKTIRLTKNKWKYLWLFQWKSCRRSVSYYNVGGCSEMKWNVLGLHSSCTPHANNTHPHNGYVVLVTVVLRKLSLYLLTWYVRVGLSLS